MSRENADAADRLERERLRRVPEYRPSFDRMYLDLLAIADAEARTQDDKKRESA